MRTVLERIVDCEQGGHDWFKARLGCVTSSRVADAIAKRKRIKDGEKNELACRFAMRVELACELLTGNASEHYVSRWMTEGKDKEPLARTEYEMRYGVTVDQVGFIYHPTIRRAGCSPDGLIGADGMLEIKAPKVETHIGYLIGGVIPEDYQPQMLWQLACDDNRQWNDFVSYCPDMPDKYQIFRQRMKRTAEVDAIIAGMNLEVEQFLQEVEEMLAQLKKRVECND